MKKVWGLIFLTLTASLAVGQKSPIQVEFTRDANNSCGHATLGSGFEKSGMVQYVARPKIIESKWNGRELIIKIFVVSECCPHDYLGYNKKGNTLNLFYGLKSNLPDKNGPKEEVDICMCGHSGCCYEFEYRIKRLKQNTNYLVAVSDVMAIGVMKPYPIGYTDSKSKSVHYASECSSFDVCLDKKIDEAVLHYKTLGTLYDSLIELHRNESIEEKEMIDKVEKVWIKYFSCREAIYDEFIRANMDHKLYNLMISDFESQVLNELKLLEPKLDIISEYLSGGTYIGPVKKIEIITDDGG